MVNMLVCLDANIWISSQLLRSPMGSALKFYLAQVNGKLLLPVVVEREVEKAARNAAREASRKFAQADDALNRFRSGIDRTDAPSVEDIVGEVRKRFAYLSPFLLRVPLSLRDVNEALELVFNDSSPNSPQKEEFRDSLLWVVARRLARRHHVHVVTNDSDFFVPGEKPRRLAPTLSAEVAARKGFLSVHEDFGALLEAANQQVTRPGSDAIVSELSDWSRVVVEQEVSGEVLSVGNVSRVNLEAFRTGKRNQLALAFEITFALQGWPGAEATAKGSAEYNHRSEFIRAATLEMLTIEQPGQSTRLIFFRA